LKELALS